MKKLILIYLSFFLSFCAFAQTDTGTSPAVADTAKPPAPIIIKKAKKKVFTGNLPKSNISDSLSVRDSLAEAQIAIPAADSISTFDSVGDLRKDTVQTKIRVASIKKPIDSFYIKLLNNPFINTKSKPIYLVINERQRQSKDEIFYLITGLLLFLAFIKLVFKKYFKNVFRLFFQPSFRQKQAREQMTQNNLPSLLLNLFFILSAATYVSFLLNYYHAARISYWPLLLYTASALLIIYLVKFIFLSFSGWVFDVKEATGSYIFAVYLINKILGVILIPFTLLIAFSQPLIIRTSVTISVLLIVILYIYRYFISFAPVRKEVKVSVLHFLLYIFAFEIMPLLLIYRTLIIYMDKSL